MAERPLHEGVVREVAFRPHGRHLASVGDDGIVDLWELPAALHREYRGHGTAVRSLAFTDNGRRFATGGEGGSVRVWEPPSDAPTRFTPDEGRLLALAWSPDGSGVLTGSVDGSAWWVDPLVGPSAHFVGHTDEVGAVFVGLYGSRVTGGRDGTLRVWDELGTEVESADTGSIVGAVAMSPDGRFVVAATEVPSIAVWDRQAGTLSHRLGHIGRIYQVQVAQDGTVVSASADGTVRGWDPATGDSALLGRFDREATTLSVFEDAFVIAGGDDGTVRWLAAGEQKTVITHDGPVGGVALSQDGRFVASVGPDTARAVDLSTGEVYDWGRGPASAVDFSGTLVFLAADDGFVYAWDPPSGTVRVVGWASVGLRQLAISPDGERVAAIGHGPHVWIWPSRPEMGEGAVRARLASLTDVVLGVEEAVVSPFTEGR